MKCSASLGRRWFTGHYGVKYTFDDKKIAWAEFIILSLMQKKDIKYLSN